MDGHDASVRATEPAPTEAKVTGVDRSAPAGGADPVVVADEQPDPAGVGDPGIGRRTAVVRDVRDQPGLLDDGDGLERDRHPPPRRRGGRATAPRRSGRRRRIDRAARSRASSPLRIGVSRGGPGVRRGPRARPRSKRVPDGGASAEGPRRPDRAVPPSASRLPACECAARASPARWRRSSSRSSPRATGGSRSRGSTGRRR